MSLTRGERHRLTRLCDLEDLVRFVQWGEEFTLERFLERWPNRAATRRDRLKIAQKRLARLFREAQALGFGAELCLWSGSKPGVRGVVCFERIRELRGALGEVIDRLALAQRIDLEPEEALVALQAVRSERRRVLRAQRRAARSRKAS